MATDNDNAAVGTDSSVYLHALPGGKHLCKLTQNT